MTAAVSSLSCPHCAASVAAAAFCQSCGKALPDPVRSAPRIITGDAFPLGIIARQVVGHELHTKANRAAYALLLVGVVLLAMGGLAWWAAERLPLAENNDSLLGATVLIVLGGTFMGLFSWAWKSPLAPSIIGLVLYCTMVAVNVLATLSSAGAGNRFAGTGIGCIDVIIIAVLIQGIQAAIGHRRLREQRV